MKLDPKSTFSISFPAVPPENSLLEFVAQNRDDLWHAARLLGGYESARLVDRCADLLREHKRLTPRTRVMLGQIQDLLSLENVHNADLQFMGFFAQIDPTDPVVTEICLLSDGLERALAAAQRP